MWVYQTAHINVSYWNSYLKQGDHGIACMMYSLYLMKCSHLRSHVDGLTILRTIHVRNFFFFQLMVRVTSIYFIRFSFRKLALCLQWFLKADTLVFIVGRPFSFFCILYSWSVWMWSFDGALQLFFSFFFFLFFFCNSSQEILNFFMTRLGKYFTHEFLVGA